MAQGFEDQVWIMTILTDCDKKKSTLVLNKIKGKVCLRHGWRKNCRIQRMLELTLKLRNDCSAIVVSM